MQPPATVRRAHGGFEWEVAAPAVEGLEPLIAAFPDLDGLEGARRIKANHFRTVCAFEGWRLPGAPGGILAKVYRYTSRWDRLRYLALAHRAEQEWTALQRLGALGLPVPQALAYASSRKGGLVHGGGLVVAFLQGAVPLAERLDALCRVEEGGGPAAMGLLERTGRLIRTLHDRGAIHRDLHAGNILVCGEADELSLIDLHTCLIRRRVPPRTRQAGIAKLIHSLRKSVPAPALRRLVEAYGLEALPGGASLASVEARLRSRVERIQRVRVRSRSRRCFLPSTQFAVDRADGARLYRLRRLTPAALEPLWRDEPPGRVLKSTPGGWVSVAAIGEEPVCVKHRRYSWREGLQALFESHDLRRAYGGGHALAVRGLPTPQVFALRERRCLGVVREAHLVTALIQGAVPLDEHLFAEYWGRAARGAPARRKHRLSRAVGTLVRSIHDEGLFPHDLSPHNVLVVLPRLEDGAASDASCLSLVDLDHLYLWKPLSRHGRLKNLADVGNLPEGHVSAADLLRGLSAYARGEPRYLERAWLLELRRRLLAAHLKTILAPVAGKAVPAGPATP